MMIKVKRMFFTIVARKAGGATTAAARAQFVMALATLALAVCVTPLTALAQCVVSTCTQAGLAACLTGPGTVTFSCGGPATIVLSSTEAIDYNITINGGGTVTIQNSGSTSFSVSPTIQFTVENLTFSGSGNGIDIAGAGSVTATGCTFGGSNHDAIFNNGPVTVTNCTFTGNVADTIDSASGPVTATGCTFTGNVADGIYSVGTLTVTNCTFSSNGAGIAALRGTITNTILAHSTGENCSGTFTDGGHNIDDGMTCGFTGTGCTTTTGTSYCNTNPGLAALANNGGPTPTMALLAGSPAIGNGNEMVCLDPPVNDVDQRGVTRSNPCAIGAFDPGAPTGVPTITEWGMIILMTLLGAGSIYYLKRRKVAI